MKRSIWDDDEAVIFLIAGGALAIIGTYLFGLGALVGWLISR